MELEATITKECDATLSASDEENSFQVGPGEKVQPSTFTDLKDNTARLEAAVGKLRLNHERSGQEEANL